MTKKIVCEKNEKISNFEVVIANFQLLCHDLGGGVISQKRGGGNFSNRPKK